MQTTNSNQNIRSNNRDWYLLAEYALGEMMPDDSKECEFTSGFLFQPFQELGVPPELISKIELTLKGFAQQTRVPVKKSRLERSGCFRVFCQKKVMDDGNVGKTSRPDYEEPTMESVPIKDPSGTILNRGWGFFFIDRSGGDASYSETSSPSVDIYIYQEGE